VNRLVVTGEVLLNVLRTEHVYTGNKAHFNLVWMWINEVKSPTPLLQHVVAAAPEPRDVILANHQARPACKVAESLAVLRDQNHVLCSQKYLVGIRNLRVVE
jgi:hypothetical protein